MGRFSYVRKGGYDPEEVDRYIETLENTIKEYREIDTAIKNAIISAQIAADNIVKNATKESNKTKAILVLQLDDIIKSITNQKMVIADFQEEYNLLMKKYLHNFNEHDIMEMYSKIDEMEQYLTRLQNSVPIDDEAVYD